MHEDLVHRLRTEKGLDKVYFDKNGGWLFVPNTFHTIIKTKEEVIAEYEASLVEEKVEAVEEGTLGGIVGEIVDQIIPPVIVKKEKDAKKK